MTSLLLQVTGFVITNSKGSKLRRRSELQCISSLNPLLLPSAAQGPVKLHDGYKFVALDLRQPQFTIEQVTVRIECAQQSVDASFVPPVGKTRPVLQRGDQSLLVAPDLPHLLI